MTTYNQSTATVCTLTDNANYQSDPLSVYQLLCHNKENNLLLESAEIDQKHLLKSLLLVDAALKIVCNGNTVTFNALTLNGQATLQFAASQLQSHAQLNLSSNKQTLTAIFSNIPTELDEKARLMAVNPFESLRLFQRIENSNNHHFAIFLGGAFAFDMISISEVLPEVPDSENTCPDFVYYLAETLVVIDHEEQSTEVIANIFSSTNRNEEQAKQELIVQKELTERITEIKELLSNDITSKKVASKAAKTLTNTNSSQTAKKLAASALSQKSRSKQTGAELEDLASKVLKSTKYNSDTKEFAASVLSQSNKER